MDDVFLGLMSGTSLDGVDAAVIEFQSGAPRVLAARTTSYEPALRQNLLALAQGESDGEIDCLGRLDRILGERFARAALDVIEEAGLHPENVRAIGSHGQTVRHRPTGPTPFTLQIADPNLIAEITGITTVADFRRRDMAAGGQGAPLVPAFHAACFRSADEDRAVLNIGGMANVTLLPRNADEPVSGFDTGPGNVLLDAWIGKQLGTRFDDGGCWASGGVIDRELLNVLLDDDYFRAPAPKSTGREHFDLRWLETRLGTTQRPRRDVQATLAALTAETVAAAMRECAAHTQRLLVCGGGTHNTYLQQLLAARLPGITIESTARYGLDPDWVEATAFAWMARETLAGRPSNLAAVTGARGPRILGGIYTA